MPRRHRPVRRWPALWRRRCACGVPWYPCVDAMTTPPPPRWTAAPEPGRPLWATTRSGRWPTVAPLLTRAQRARGARGQVP